MKLYSGSNYLPVSESNLNRIDVVFTYPVGFVALDPGGGGVVCGLVYHRAEVEISSQTLVTGPEK